jgi:hypothetical protein
MVRWKIPAKSEVRIADHEVVNEFLEKEPCGFRQRTLVHEMRDTEKAGALPCSNRAFMSSVEAIGVSSEREADSPID